MKIQILLSKKYNVYMNIKLVVIYLRFQEISRKL